MTVENKILPLVQLVSIAFQLVIGSTTRWLEDVAGADLLYSPSLLNTTVSSLVTCLVCCSNIEKCKAATYHNGTGDCNCFESKTSRTSQPGNRLWNRPLEQNTPTGSKSNGQVGWLFKVIDNELKTYAEAESYCAELGGRLAVLDTDEKLKYVTGLSDYPKLRYVFVGATDEDTEGKYLWSTGAVLTNTNWGLGQPGIGKGINDCVALLNSKFDDIWCLMPTNFVCENADILYS